MAGALTYEELLLELSYDPETGVFRRRATGLIAGTRVPRIPGSRSQRYVHISINGRLYLGHRLAWLYQYGCWPTMQLDHKNGNSRDNRIENLRLATPAQNLTNVGVLKTNKLRVRGVHRHKNGKYRAMISRGDKSYHLGYYKSLEEARAAYLNAALAIHGEFVRRD